MLKKITKWETEDGKVFDTQEEAEDYMFEQEKEVMTRTTEQERFEAWYEENIGDENKPVREAAFSAWQASRRAPAVSVSQSIEQMAVDRYKVVPSHESMFHCWAVVAGNGTQQLYIGREAECQNMARKFTGAFLDGAFVALAAAPRPAAAALAPSIAVTPEMVEAANEAYCPFGDMELALCAALQVAPIPPGAAPVKEE